MSSKIKHILSVSLGSSARDKTVEVSLLGQRLLLDRRGTDGDVKRFEEFILRHDGAVDVLCVGGTNLGMHCGDRLYPYRSMSRLMDQIRHTPVVDGSGIKATLEPRTLEILQERGVVDFSRTRVLLSSSVDRFGMAETLDRLGAEVVYGDLLFGAGLPVPLHRLSTARGLARRFLPLLMHLPLDFWWHRGPLTPRHPRRWRKYFDWAEVLAGDFPTLRRHLPASIADKVVITNSTTEDDETELANRGARMVVTTSPLLEGRAFATNVLEGVFVALLEKPPEALRHQDYFALADRLGWEPNVRELT